MVTDAEGRIVFANKKAKALLSLDREVIGLPFSETVRLVNRTTGLPVGDLILLTILQGTTLSLRPGVVIDTPAQSEIEGTVVLSRMSGVVIGATFVFKETAPLTSHEQQGKDDANHAYASLASLLSGAFSRTLASSSVSDSHAKPDRALRALIEQLAQISELRPSSCRPTDMNALVADVEHEMSHGLPGGSPAVTSMLDHDLPRLYIDQEQLRSALSTLVRYLMETTGANTPVHIITMRLGKATTPAHGQHDDLVGVTLQAALPADYRGPSFEVGEPVSGTAVTADRPDLRLFFVERVITAANGSIRAQTTGGRLEVEIQLRNGRAPRGSASSNTILLVYPDNTMREFIADVLEQQGYEVLGARAAAEAAKWSDLYLDAISIIIIDIDDDSSGDLDIEPLMSSSGMARVVLIAQPEISATIETRWQGHDVHVVKKPLRLTELITAMR